LASNLNYITASSQAGASGIFLDEVSQYPSSSSLAYLKQIADKAHSLGLKVVFNVGVDSWSDSLMSYCDYVNSSEVWNNAPLSASQTRWASRTWLLTQGVNDAATAASLTKAAWSKGILAEYACNSYTQIPGWLGSYASLLASYSPTTAPSASSLSATGVTSNAATVNGNLTSMGSASTVQVSFDWGTTSSYGNDTPPLTATAIGAYSYSLTMLSPNTTYHFRAKAQGNGTVYGNDVTFTTPAAIQAGGNTTGIVANKPSPDGGTNSYNFYLRIRSTSVPGFTIGQRVWCSATTTDFPNLLNVGATISGNLDHSLGWWVLRKASPPVVPPAVATGSATGIAATGAILNGTLTSLGSSTSVSAGFDWGLTSSYGNTTTVQTLTASNTFGTALTGLSAGTTYHFRARATGSGSTVYGTDLTFTTASATPNPSGNTAGTVANTPSPSGGANEYNLYLNITSTSIPGLVAGQQVWCSATTTDFPNLLTVGTSLTGNLDHSLGWWVLKR
jgi:hypothetical protein